MQERSASSANLKCSRRNQTESAKTMDHARAVVGAREFHNNDTFLTVQRVVEERVTEPRIYRHADSVASKSTLIVDYNILFHVPCLVRHFP